jgi:ABC-2 type transport system ATP-binding protein
MSVIAVDNLRKHYGAVKAVEGITFWVQESETLGFLEPNVAGKTTTIEIIEAYKTPDSGSVTALGLDPRKNGYDLKEHIGIMHQKTSLYLDFKVDELLRLPTGIP